MTNIFVEACAAEVCSQRLTGNYSLSSRCCEGAGLGVWAARSAAQRNLAGLAHRKADRWDGRIGIHQHQKPMTLGTYITDVHHRITAKLPLNRQFIMLGVGKPVFVPIAGRA